MRYTLAIDWLSFFCLCGAGRFAKCEDLHKKGGVWDMDCAVENTDQVPLMQPYPWTYEKAEHGTRQYKELWTVYLNKDEIATVQAEPCSPKILNPRSCIVKFSNRLLYRHDLWDIVDRFLFDHELNVSNVSRVDIAADFNQFNTYECVPFIADFLSSKLRHKGQGKGAAYFHHYTIPQGIGKVQRIQYTGLSFGTHESDARVYLYNKTNELKEHDKPWIRDLWKAAGLNVHAPIWRLEVSIKSKAAKFRDKTSGTDYTITGDCLHNVPEISRIYHTFVHKLFAFVHNREGITNITREPIIDLFGDNAPYMDRQVLRDVCGSTRSDKMLIKALWLSSQRYRGRDIVEDEGVSKLLAEEIAACTDLLPWYLFKRDGWKEPHRN